MGEGCLLKGHREEERCKKEECCSSECAHNCQDAHQKGESAAEAKECHRTLTTMRGVDDGHAC